MLDWRIQAIATVAQDVPPAYPGGPSHPAGSQIALTSLVDTPQGPLAFVSPSTVALALSIASKAAKTAASQKALFSSVNVPAPDGTVSLLSDSTTGDVFDFFEQCFVVVVFSYQAIEAFCNYKISYAMKDAIELERKGQIVRMTRAEVERTSTDKKLATVLPLLLAVPSPRGRREWERYLELKQVRDATIHMKSHHQWTGKEPFDESPYTFFLNEAPETMPLRAIEVIGYFARDHEVEWLKSARGLLQD